MQAHILFIYTPSTLGWDQKVKTFVFPKVVKVHIKFMGMERDLRAPCKHMSREM